MSMRQRRWALVALWTAVIFVVLSLVILAWSDGPTAGRVGVCGLEATGEGACVISRAPDPDDDPPGSGLNNGAELSISKTDLFDPWYIAWTVNYDIYITNTGSVDLTGVMVQDFKPVRSYFVDAYTATVKTWVVGPLSVGDSRHFSVEIRSFSSVEP